MTEYRECPRCKNENETEVYQCRYCAILYCDACRPESTCPKNPEEDEEMWHGHDDKTIGYISGICDICRKSMYGYERFYLGKYNKISGHKECLDAFLETDEGERWRKSEKKKEKKAEEEKRKALIMNEEKEKAKQERLKQLEKFQVNFDPFDKDNLYYSVFKNSIEYYSKNTGDDGKNYWIIFVTPEDAEKIRAERKKVEEIQKNAETKKQREIRGRKTKKVLKWCLCIIIPLVVGYIFLRIDK